MDNPQSFSSRFESALRQSVLWVRSHQEQFWAISGTIIGGALLVYFMVHRRQVENEDAWTQLGIAQSYAMQGQTDQAVKALNDWTTHFQGTSATSYAKFIRADLMYKTSDYVTAAQIYGDLAVSGQPLVVRPLALSAQSASLEMAGRIPEATAVTQHFLDQYPDHFLTASMYISQARLAELSGNTASATAVYDRFVILYPQSPWTAFARARLQTLAAPAPLKK